MLGEIEYLRSLFLDWDLTEVDVLIRRLNIAIYASIIFSLVKVLFAYTLLSKIIKSKKSKITDHFILIIILLSIFMIFTMYHGNLLFSAHVYLQEESRFLFEPFFNTADEQIIAIFLLLAALVLSRLSDNFLKNKVVN